MRKYDVALREMHVPGPNIEKVLELLRAAADDCDHRAEYALATWYLHGTHLAKDLEKAVKLLNLAAAKGNASAMYDLAVCYERGQGVEKCERRAFNFYVSAAWRGDNQSLCEVGRCLYYGIGTVEDRNLAKLWLDKASKYGINVKDNEID